MSNDNKKTYVQLSCPTVFSDGKAYVLSISNGKIRISIVQCTVNNGQQSWDFKNSSGVSIDFEDASRFLIACKQLAAIYLDVKRNPSIISTNQIYNTNKIVIPLIAKTTGNTYGSIMIGFAESKDGNNDRPFCMAYETTTKDGSTSNNFFIFKKYSGPSSEINFVDKNNVNIKQATVENAMYANFIRHLEYLISCGVGAYSIQNYLAFNKGFGSGGGHYSKNNGNPYGGDNNSGGESSGNGGESSSSDNFPEDIPF
jgi:hypothetical protein